MGCNRRAFDDLTHDQKCGVRSAMGCSEKALEDLTPPIQPDLRFMIRQEQI